MDLQFMIYSTILIYIEILVYISCILLLVQYNFASLLSPILVNLRYSQWERQFLPWSPAGDSLVRTESAQVNPMYSQWKRPELLPWNPLAIPWCERSRHRSILCIHNGRDPSCFRGVPLAIPWCARSRHRSIPCIHNRGDPHLRYTFLKQLIACTNNV